MTSTEINTTLAGVEGKYCVDSSHEYSNCGTCLTCGLFKILPDYTTSLDPCMRVARKLNVWVCFTTKSLKPAIDISWMTQEGNPILEMTDGNDALTLATMLAEIVKEQP